MNIMHEVHVSISRAMAKLNRMQIVRDVFKDNLRNATKVNWMT